MIQKRCSNCNRLLFTEQNGIKTIKVDNITYNVNGKIEITCKCRTINKF